MSETIKGLYKFVQELEESLAILSYDYSWSTDIRKSSSPQTRLVIQKSKGYKSAEDSFNAVCTRINSIILSSEIHLIIPNIDALSFEEKIDYAHSNKIAIRRLYFLRRDINFRLEKTLQTPNDLHGISYEKLDHFIDLLNLVKTLIDRIDVRLQRIFPQRQIDPIREKQKVGNRNRHIKPKSPFDISNWELFNYLVKHFAVTLRPIDLSNIYTYMREMRLLRFTQKEYIEFVKGYYTESHLRKFRVKHARSVFHDGKWKKNVKEPLDKHYEDFQTSK